MGFLLLAFLFSVSAQAEYRAFELVITNNVTGQERTVFSSLDPDQYRGYHPLSPNEQIASRDTWMCRGNTANKQVCPKPERPPPQAAKPAPGPNSKPSKP